MLFFSNYMMIFFTEFILDAERKYEIGFMMSYLVLLVMGFNITLVISDLFSFLLLQYKKWFHKRAWDHYHLLEQRMIDFIKREFSSLRGWNSSDKTNRGIEKILRRELTFQ